MMGKGAPTLFEQLHRELPQTQCQRCGYPDCAAYAQAMADGQAPINRCPPGGAEGIARLARITGLPVQPLDAECGHEGPRSVAWIDEASCIGCTLCLKACPTDAIFGANKAMHTIIEAECTGCELCVPACPVDCIRLDTVTGERSGWAAWSQGQAEHALDRYRQHQARQAQPPKPRPQDAHMHTHQGKPANLQPRVASTASAVDRKAVIAAALAKARGQRQA